MYECMNECMYMYMCVCMCMYASHPHAHPQQCLFTCSCAYMITENI